jgi:hypothetical protein
VRELDKQTVHDRFSSQEAEEKIRKAILQHASIRKERNKPGQTAKNQMILKQLKRMKWGQGKR